MTLGLAQPWWHRRGRQADAGHTGGGERSVPGRVCFDAILRPELALSLAARSGLLAITPLAAPGWTTNV